MADVSKEEHLLQKKEDEKQEHLLLSTREAAKYIGVGAERVRELTEQQHNPLPAIYLPRCPFPKYTKAIIDQYFMSIAVPKIGEKNG